MDTPKKPVGRPSYLTINDTERNCSMCKVLKTADNFMRRPDGKLGSYCRDCRNLQNRCWVHQVPVPGITARRPEYKGDSAPIRKKRILLETWGAVCQRCGYSKSISALHFHHIDSSQKKEMFSARYGSLIEVEKHPERFLLLCANCHAEEHYLKYGR